MFFYLQINVFNIYDSVRDNFWIKRTISCYCRCNIGLLF